MRIYLQKSEIPFRFAQTKEDFIVDEIPNREFACRGKYLIAKIKKQEMTTWDAVAVFARYLGIDASEIGYAGLKDKHATTTQYFSFDSRAEKVLRRFKHKKIAIEGLTKDTKKIRTGDLSGNRFTINLYDIDNIKAGQIEKTATKIVKNGLVNYFGFQRFGKNGDAIEEAKEMVSGERHIEDIKVRKFLVSVYQSHLFNEWLKKRVQISEDGKFKLLQGDVYVDEEGKLFTPQKIPLKDFLAKKISPTGLLCGRDVFRAKGDARDIEKEFDDEFLPYKGYRRAAIVFPKVFALRFYQKEQKAAISFTLPKGSYATSFVEALRGESLSD